MQSRHTGRAMRKPPASNVDDGVRWVDYCGIVVTDVSWRSIAGSNLSDTRERSKPSYQPYRHVMGRNLLPHRTESQTTAHVQALFLSIIRNNALEDVCRVFTDLALLLVTSE
jgi:hypothetical protein